MPEKEKITKKGISKVVPSGDFISNLAIEVARRVIRNQEKVTHQLDEIMERFPNMTEEQVYTLLGELQQLGIDVTPNEWLYFKPVEYRIAALSNLPALKTAKVYGSRYEDIMELISNTKDQIKEVQAWLKDNESLRRLSPQTYNCKKEQIPALECIIADLETTLKLGKGAVIFDNTYGGGSVPLKPLNIAIADKVYMISRTGNGQIVQSPVSDLRVKSAVDEAFQEDAENDVSIDKTLSEKFEDLRYREPLSPFFEDWYNIYSGGANTYDTPEAITEAVNSLVDYVNDTAPEKDIDEQQRNLALEELAKFSEENNLETSAAKHDQSSVFESEDEDQIELGGVSDREDLDGPVDEDLEPIGAREVGGTPPDTEGTVMHGKARPKTNIGSVDKEIAKSLQYLDRISRLLSDVRTSATIPKTAHVDTAIDNLQGVIGDIKFHIETNLPYNSDIERKAARTVLSNIMKKLSSLVDLYAEKDGSDEVMRYLMASDFLKAAASTKRLLLSLGD